MFKHKSSKFLKSVFDNVQLVSNKATISFNVDGLRLNVADDSQIMYLFIFLAKDEFEVYEHTQDKRITISVETFCKFLKFTENAITFKFVDDSVNVTMNGGKTKMSFAITDDDSDEMNNLTFTFDYIFTFNSDEFSKRMSYFKDISSVISVSIKPTEFEFELSGESSTTNLTDSIDHKTVKVNNQTTIQVSYSLPHLMKITKLNFFSSTVDVGISEENAPFSMLFTNKNSYIQYYIAPKSS